MPLNLPQKCRLVLVISEEYNLSMDTFDDYVGAFNKLFVINDLEAWCPLIREHNLAEKQVPIREPDQLIVLTGGTMAYTRQDGVKIIPLGCLKW